MSYPSGMTVSSRALIMLTDRLRQHRNAIGTRWRRLDTGRQALPVVAHLRKGETYAELACGFAIGTSTVYRYLREALDLLAAMAPTLQQAIEVARGKAHVILDGTLLRIDRIGMTGGRDRPYYSGKHKCHGLNVQVIADPVGRLIWMSPALPGCSAAKSSRPAPAHDELAVERDVAEPRAERVDHLGEERGERAQLARLQPRAARGDGADRPDS